MTDSSPPPSGSGLRRLSRTAKPMRVPEPLEGRRGLVVVDSTWGQINPIELAPQVRTVGELEVIGHIEEGKPLVDSRPNEAYAKETIPGARNVPHGEIKTRVGELDPNVETILFCNGPQCAATPDSVRVLLGAAFPAQSILYYRGGLHDWLTLGLPTIIPGGASVG